MKKKLTQEQRSIVACSVLTTAAAVSVPAYEFLFSPGFEKWSVWRTAWTEAGFIFYFPLVLALLGWWMHFLGGRR